eukprot:CAMPEP_0168315904 /NCGR_PEP_ID=MMETSP0210-20121227/13213_1 /TAXON_ID=40633 /ORGANISM="Condylostoma magnum, Strain COL2" /LENGTH=160 /DNA_ID=CAMNT_0008292539 /DNA_START=16883 /DNA_END=17365 /DNA_ORIENTATION=+
MSPDTTSTECASMEFAGDIRATNLQSSILGCILASETDGIFNFNDIKIPAVGFHGSIRVRIVSNVTAANWLKPEAEFTVFHSFSSLTHAAVTPVDFNTISSFVGAANTANLPVDTTIATAFSLVKTGVTTAWDYGKGDILLWEADSDIQGWGIGGGAFTF